jgi:fucose 4-O-acetylase-like acetyltransferase
MKRDIQIDTAKGIAIFFVVAGHISSGVTSQIIFLFHMPFFFIVSGYLHRINRQEIKYLKRKTISLLIPYFVYLSIFAQLSMYSLLLKLIKYPSQETISSFLRCIYQLLYGGEILKGYFGIFWFVTCLFLTQQLFNFIMVRVNNTKVILGIAIILYFISFFNQTSPKHLVFPWAVNVVCCSFLFYSVGSIYGNHIFKIQNIILVLVAAMISIFSVVLVISGFKLSFDMKYTYYGFFIVSPLAAISFTKVLSIFAYFLTKNNLLISILTFAGQASITIMFWHQFFHFLLIELCDKWPWFMTFAILVACCILHWLFLKNSLSRALLLGSRKDIDLLTSPLHRNKV